MYDARKRTAITILEGEDFSHAVEFADVLGIRTISSVSRTAFNPETGLSDTACCPDAPVKSGTKVVLRLVGTDSGRAWRVYVFAALNSGETIGHLLEVECA
jgi:hypothetical protein